MKTLGTPSCPDQWPERVSGRGSSVDLLASVTAADRQTMPHTASQGTESWLGNSGIVVVVVGGATGAAAGPPSCKASLCHGTATPLTYECATDEKST